MINIPSNENPILQQNNRGSRLGNIVGSFNLDLRGDITATRGNRGKLIYSTNDDANFDSQGIGITMLGAYNANYYTVTNRVWEGDNSAFDQPSQVSTTPSTSDEGDTIVFKNGVWVSGENNLWYSAEGNLSGTWTALTTGLTAGDQHLLAVLGNRMYVTDLEDQIGTVTGDYTGGFTYTDADPGGTGTFDFALEGYSITTMFAGNDRLWIALSPTGNSSTAQVCWIYEWDGESQNDPTRKYKIDTQGILAGCSVNGTPVFLDTLGRLLSYNGTGFTEIARFPLNAAEQLWGVGAALGRNRAVHPKGMIFDGDEILINITNRIEGSTTAFTTAFQSGVWAWNAENGLYHKFSSSYSPVTSTAVTDYGQQRVLRAGPIIEYRPNNPDANDGGEYIWSAQYLEDEGTSTGVTGIFTNDTKDTTEKSFYFITPRLFSGNIVDTWNKVWAKFKPLINNADKIVVKYRVDEDVELEFTGDWTATNRFYADGSFTDFEVGDEVEIIQGVGAGLCAHIETITTTGGSVAVTLDNDLTNASGGFIGIMRNFKKAGDADRLLDTKGWKGMAIPHGNKGTWIQFKVYLQGTGQNEIYGISIVNRNTIKE